MGNKVVIFTEEQFEDYQVSDTHQHPSTWLEAFIPKKSQGSLVAIMGMYQIHTNYYVSVGFHISEDLDCGFLGYETMQSGL